MGDSFWFSFFQFLATIILAGIGYFGLRHKASLDNVVQLEAQIGSLTKRVGSLESDLNKCQAERRRLIEEKSVVAEELARTKIEVAARDAAMTLASTAELARNTALTAQTNEALRGFLASTPKAAEKGLPVKVEVVPASKPLPVKETP